MERQTVGRVCMRVCVSGGSKERDIHSRCADKCPGTGLWVGPGHTSVSTQEELLSHRVSQSVSAPGWG